MTRWRWRWSARWTTPGFATAHLAGNSLGGYTALRLAARGRARSVVALAPAGGWAEGDDSYQDTLQHFITAQDLVKAAAPHAEAIAASPEGRRRATEYSPPTTSTSRPRSSPIRSAGRPGAPALAR